MLEHKKMLKHEYKTYDTVAAWAGSTYPYLIVCRSFVSRRGSEEPQQETVFLQHHGLSIKQVRMENNYWIYVHTAFACLLDTVVDGKPTL